MKYAWEPIESGGGGNCGRGLVRDRKVTPIPSFPSLAQHECRFRYVHIDIGRRYILEQCGVVPIRTYR